MKRVLIGAILVGLLMVGAASTEEPPSGVLLRGDRVPVLCQTGHGRAVEAQVYAWPSGRRLKLIETFHGGDFAIFGGRHRRVFVKQHAADDPLRTVEASGWTVLYDDDCGGAR